MNYSQDPTTNQWTQNTSLSPAEQNIFNQTTQAQGSALGIANNQLGNVQNALNTPLAPTGPLASNVQSGPVQQSIGPSDFNQAVGNTINSNYNTQMGLLQPQMDQAAEHQNAQLIAQGLNPNDAAYQNSQTLFDQGQASQRAQVANNAVNSGNAEQNLLFGQQAAQGQFANSAQAQQFGQGAANANLYNAANQQQFNNTAYAQQNPINEFNSLMSSSQVQAPQSTAAQTSVSPTDVTGAYGLQAQQQNAQYQAQLANYQSGMGGLFSLGSAAIMAMSDVRLKRDIVPTGDTLGGFPTYSFRYVWDAVKRHVGVMAQEVIKTRPDAVHVHPSGFYMVDYGALQ